MGDHKPTRTRPTGTPAQGYPSSALAVTRSCWDRLPRAVRCSPAAPKFLIVDAVPQHDEKADQELPGHGDLTRERGWIEGREIVIEWRWVEGKPERYPDLAADLVRLNVDVIVAGSNA